MNSGESPGCVGCVPLLIGVLLVLFLLLAVAVIVAAIAILFVVCRFLYWQLTGRPERGEGAVSQFGAPATSWWFDTYEYWLFRLEDLTHQNFTSSPERLLAGSMLIAGGLGSGIATAAGLAAAQLSGSPFSLELVGYVFLIVVVVCNLSAWGLSQPAKGWWQPTATNLDSSEPSGFILGNLLDDD